MSLFLLIFDILLTHISMKPKNWPDYLAMIEERPSMFLGKTSIIRLQFEIQGILVAEDLYDVPEEKRLGGFSFGAFEAWVDATYNVDHLTMKSFTLAQYLTSSNRESFLERGEEDSAQAFEMWFAWYHEYQSKQTD